MRLISIAFGIALTLVGGLVSAKERATWIWNPGDFEIWLSNELQVKRVERDALFMPFWRFYSHQPQVNFTKRIELAESEEITVTAEGVYAVSLDHRLVQGNQRRIVVPAGKHMINIQVYNQASPPAVHVQGKTIHSDASWSVDALPNREASNSNAVYAGNWNFDTPDAAPSRYKLPTREVKPVKVERNAHSVLVDFGQETIGFVKLGKLTGSGKVTLYFGESREEALAIDKGETLDRYVASGSQGDFVATNSRALRYVNIQVDEGMQFDDVSLLYEYLPLAHRGTFKSSDTELNKIWDTSVRSLELNTRAFFIDGIKRDHWLWSGDAVQSYLMNYYSFFDKDAVKRTTWALRGADPVDMHINTILDYSLYWFIGIQDYYQYTGDEAFVKSVFPRMVTLMDFVLGRRNSNGMLEGLPGDWVFVDWASMPKEGELSVIQLLFARSLDAMADSAALVQDTKREAMYRQLATELKAKIMATFWDQDQQVFIHSRNGSKLNKLVTRHPNMFALMFGYLDAPQAESVKKNVLLNDKVAQITTPYMRFYELAALADSGQQHYVTRQMKDYWGGMLKDGASCFWEQYDPKIKTAERYAMYGKAFGMSLCHAWGASPIYLLGKYYFGVKPTAPGYQRFVVEPSLGGLDWIEGKVPTPHGEIALRIDRTRMKLSTPGGQGVLRFKSARAPRSNHGVIRSLGGRDYELQLDSGKEYTVTYSSVDADRVN